MGQHSRMLRPAELYSYGCLPIRLSDDGLTVALEQLEALALASMLCKWSKRARRERCLAVLRELGYAGATPQPQPERAHGRVALPEALQLGADEKAALLEALDGPLYAKTPGLSRPILLSLNEFVLQRSDRGYVQYEVRAAAAAIASVAPTPAAAAVAVAAAATAVDLLR